MSEMVSSLTDKKSTHLGGQQLEVDSTKLIQSDSPLNPVDLDLIDVNAPRGKEPKSLRVERKLLKNTEEMREKTNLSFSEYVETALLYFNACLDQHFTTVQSTEQTGDKPK